jgi:hypothetical protein
MVSINWFDLPSQILVGKPELPEMEDIWAKKVELSDFIELDLVGWIARVERFFEEQEVHPSNKLQWPFMSMKSVRMLVSVLVSRLKRTLMHIGTPSLEL